MAFKPSYNIMDRDTHNALVNAFKTGGIAYTDDDGTVHKIADDYINSSGGGGGILYVEIAFSNDGMSATANKNYEEITAAISAENCVVFSMPNPVAPSGITSTLYGVLSGIMTDNASNFEVDAAFISQDLLMLSLKASSSTGTLTADLS